MNSECESHYPRAGREPGAAEGNCVAARGVGSAGSGRLVRNESDSIRRAQRASLLGKGEVCRVSGESVTVLDCHTGHRPVRVWVESDDRKGAWRSGDPGRRLSRDGVRGSIVAVKPGNAGGAKGPRKVTRDGNAQGTKPAVVPGRDKQAGETSATPIRVGEGTERMRRPRRGGEKGSDRQSVADRTLDGGRATRWQRRGQHHGGALRQRLAVCST